MSNMALSSFKKAFDNASKKNPAQMAAHEKSLHKKADRSAIAPRSKIRDSSPARKTPATPARKTPATPARKVAANESKIADSKSPFKSAVKKQLIKKGPKAAPNKIAKPKRAMKSSYFR